MYEKIILQTEDCGGGEAAGVVCDTARTNHGTNPEKQIEKLDDEEETDDNCVLASPLYYPLRRSESHYKRYKWNNTQS